MGAGWECGIQGMDNSSRNGECRIRKVGEWNGGCIGGEYRIGRTLTLRNAGFEKTLGQRVLVMTVQFKPLVTLPGWATSPICITCLDCWPDNFELSSVCGDSK
jgi:hypothetical protein